MVGNRPAKNQCIPSDLECISHKVYGIGVHPMLNSCIVCVLCLHDDVIKWKHFPRNWPFVREIHRSPVNFPHKGQWRGALMFSLIYAWINDWVNNREAGDLRRQHGHYDVIVMTIQDICTIPGRKSFLGFFHCLVNTCTGDWVRLSQQASCRYSTRWYSPTRQGWTEGRTA